MNTSKIKKIERRYHCWNLRIDFGKRWEVKKSLGLSIAYIVIGSFLYISLVCGKTPLSVGYFIGAYVALFACVAMFGICFVDFLISMAKTLCGIYLEQRACVDEQKYIDFGTVTSYYDPETKTEYTEEEYQQMVNEEKEQFEEGLTVSI